MKLFSHIEQKAMDIRDKKDRLHRELSMTVQMIQRAGTFERKFHRTLVTFFMHQ